MSTLGPTPEQTAKSAGAEILAGAEALLTSPFHALEHATLAADNTVEAAEASLKAVEDGAKTTGDATDVVANLGRGITAIGNIVSGTVAAHKAVEEYALGELERIVERDNPNITTPAEKDLTQAEQQVVMGFKNLLNIPENMVNNAAQALIDGGDTLTDGATAVKKGTDATANTAAVANDATNEASGALKVVEGMEKAGDAARQAITVAFKEKRDSDKRHRDISNEKWKATHNADKNASTKPKCKPCCSVM